MGSWWDITFAATGDFARLHDLKSSLPRLFHQTIDADFKGGVLIANVMENYGGGPAIDAAIESYPDLLFNGVMVHESVWNDGGAYYPFSGSNGVSAWRKLILPEDEGIMSSDEIQDGVILNDQTVSVVDREGQQIGEIDRMNLAQQQV